MSILNEVILCEPNRVQTLIIRSRAFEMQGQDDRAMRDLLTAQKYDSLNKII